MHNRDRNAQRKVAIYGRVSTEHEAQLSAFENQQEWYEHEARRFENWTIVDRYYDEGITGTSAEKRPAFMRMMRDAETGKFDLIMTREVCRFARNTVDALQYTRALRDMGVEIYFVQDNIWSMDGDGELRLTFMSSFAQEESRKISERVRAGQQISREKGVLYGSGNILGYDRVGKSYVINEEQAATVRLIYKLYDEGLGYRRISEELMRLGLKNASGQSKWDDNRIGRILRNATYMGYIGYNKSSTQNYLTQKRRKTQEEDFVYVKGDFEPIVSEELWQRCAEKRNRRNHHIRDENGKLRKFGSREPTSVWTRKLLCSCGSTFRKFLWHVNSKGEKRYGYECYRRKQQPNLKTIADLNLDETQLCPGKSIPYWHIDLMARKVFTTVWKDRKEAVLLACQMIEECMVQEKDQTAEEIDLLKFQIMKAEQKQAGLREMRALGDISREIFVRDHSKLETEIEALQKQIDMLKSQPEQLNRGIDLERIRKTLDRWIDLNTEVVSEALVEQFVRQVKVIDSNTYDWTLDFSKDAQLQRRNSWRELLPTRMSSASIHPVSEPKELLRFEVIQDEAAAYCKEIGVKFFAKKWQDKTVIVSI